MTQTGDFLPKFSGKSLSVSRSLHFEAFIQESPPARPRTPAGGDSWVKVILCHMAQRYPIRRVGHVICILACCDKCHLGPRNVRRSHSPGSRVDVSRGMIFRPLPRPTDPRADRPSRRNRPPPTYRPPYRNDPPFDSTIVDTGRP